MTGRRGSTRNSLAILSGNLLCVLSGGYALRQKGRLCNWPDDLLYSSRFLACYRGLRRSHFLLREFLAVEIANNARHIGKSLIIWRYIMILFLVMSASVDLRQGVYTI